MTEKQPRELDVSREDILAVIDSISLFGGLTPEQLDEIIRLIGTCSYRTGEQIFARGDQPSHIYIVFSGSVRLDFETKHHPLSGLVFNQGECFGETSVIGIQPHSASAFAEQNTQLLVIARDVLLALYQDNLPLFGILVLNIAREAARRLHTTDQWFSEYVDTHH